jgi:hypothetical protein
MKQEMKLPEKLRLYQRIEWGSLTGIVIISILSELLVLAIFYLLHTDGDLLSFFFFINIWILLTTLINIALILLLIVYRPEYWYFNILPLLLLPIMPIWIIIIDMAFNLGEMVKSLS